ncbi:MAG: hypothetical protein KDA91_16620, partial [Planctomycetaceae bacterium]|nr:hypothetical protein [Planctomycetaceae bacterium]
SLVDRLGRPVKEGVSKRRVPEAKEKRVAPKSPGARSRRSSDDAGRISASAMTKGNKPVSLRDVKSILGKLGGGYAGTVHRNKKLHEVSFSTLRKYPGIKDAERLATLPNVDWFSVGGEKLSAEKLRILQTLIMGWSQLRTLIATGVTGGFAAWICSHAPLMDSLENLELDGTDVTDADLEALKNCSMLREINLSSTRVTIKGLTSLTQVQSLQRVSICNCDQISIADASKFVVRHPGRFDLSFIKNEAAMGMQSSTAQEKSRHLKQNARVISVFEKSRNAGPNRFFGTTLVVEAIPTPVSLQDMANECCVEKLVIGSYYTGEVKGLTGDDFKFLLTAWPDLRELQIAKIPDSEGVLKETISRLKQLRKLELINTPCGDTVLPAIATLKNLVQLELHGTRITGAGLRLLSKLSKLRWLGLVGNPNLKPDDVDKFRELTVGKMWIDFQK